MNKEWCNIFKQISDDYSKYNEITCPICGEKRIKYMFVGDPKNRVGYLQIWCDKCLKGIHISRSIAPLDANFISMEENAEGLLPKFELLF